jgi:hypothetical protein
MKTNGYFLLIALLVLGYLHLMTKFAQRIDLSVQQEGLATQHHSTQPSRAHRLLAVDAQRQLEQATQSVPSLVQNVSGHPIPNWDELQQWDILHDAQLRSERVLYVITPTHYRVMQRVDLIRLKQTLMLASLQYGTKIYWILIEDAEQCSQRLRHLAEDSGLFFAHKAITQKQHDDLQHGHRGLLQRNLGLETVLEIGKEGVIYFADDDNGYDVSLFSRELLYTRYTSIFAVGLSGGSAWERCHVNRETGQVDAILSTWKPRYRVPNPKRPGKFIHPKRKFAIDMAGFALSTTALQTKQARFTPESTSGMLETDFLSQLVQEVSELEPLAANCTRILVWHVKTMEPEYFNNPEKDEETFQLLKSLL